MYSSRRVFLGISMTLAAAAATGAARQEQQQPPQPFPSRSEPAEPPPLLKPSRKLLKANRETITKDVTRMADLVGQLQKSLDENSTVDVLSLDVLRKSEEIEKLARQVRDLVRG
jgi:hypothetical protein